MTRRARRAAPWRLRRRITDLRHRPRARGRHNASLAYLYLEIDTSAFTDSLPRPINPSPVLWPEPVSARSHVNGSRS